MNVVQATRIFHAAQEWPRCGQQWPTGASEEAAALALQGRNECGRTEAEEAEVAAEFEARLAASASAQASQAASRQEAIASALALVSGRTSRDLATVAGRVSGLTVEEAEEAGFDSRAINAGKLNKLFAVNRRDQIVVL